MKRLILVFAILPAMLACCRVEAQDLDKLPKPGDQEPVAMASDQVDQTESMWFYLQELRRHDDPQVTIRRKAELKANQRRQRLAAMKWFGWMQGRPTANPTPGMGYYSPMWSGNGGDPNLWIGNAYVTTTVRVTAEERSRLQR